MATVDKNFKVKHGLIVEGNTATVNGEDILTTGSTVTTDFVTEGSNLYFTAERAANAVADEISNAVTSAINALTTDVVEEGTSNLYFTDQRAIDAVGGSATSANTANTVVKRDGAGAFSAGTISATQLNVQDAGSIFEDSSLIIQSNSGYPIDISGNQNVTITSANGDIILNADGTTYLTSAASGNQVATRGYVDGLASNYDAAGAAATAESNANGYTDTALQSYTPTSGLDAAIDGYGYLKSADLNGYATEGYVTNAIADVVGLAPEALDTLQELAAAFDNSPDTLTNLVTTVGGKQNSFTAGDGLGFTTNNLSLTVQYGNGLSIAGGNLVVDTNTIATVSYVDTNFVNVADLPGQLDDYVPVTEKGQALGVATLDASGYVPVEQLGNVPANYVTSVWNNLSVTDGVLNLGQFVALEETDISTTGLSTGFGTMGDFREVSKIVSNRANVNVGSPYAFTFTGSAAKLIIAAKSGADVHVSEVLIAIDASAENAYVTEYASIATSTDLFSVDSVTVGNPNEVIISTLSGQISVSVTLQTIRF